MFNDDTLKYKKGNSSRHWSRFRITSRFGVLCHNIQSDENGNKIENGHFSTIFFFFFNI